MKGKRIRNLLELVILGVSNGVAEVDQELRQATLGSGVIAEDVREGRVTERLGKALTESLPSAIVVAESMGVRMSHKIRRAGHTSRSNARRA